MIVLGIDTATAASSVAVVDGGDVLAMGVHVDARAHAEVLAPLLEDALREADARPELIAVGVGPGPYTGLRVGIATARTLGLAWDVPVVGVCSLDAIATAALHAGIVATPHRDAVSPEPAHGSLAEAASHAASTQSAAFVVATDARRKEVYWASYDSAGSRLDGPFVGRVADVPAEVRALPWVGEGVDSTPGNADQVNAVALDVPHIADASDIPRTPDASDIARLAAAWVAAGVEPAQVPAHWSAHGTDDGTTARSLSGLTLLQPYPLYVRRADAAAPSSLVPSLNQAVTP